MKTKNNWMSKISDETKLVNVNIPGTHDSGTYGTIIPFARTQNWTIEEQLNQGIRFLDIRLSKVVSKDAFKPIGTLNSSAYILMHGPAPVGGNFYDDVLNPVNNFLKKNPKEVIFMSIKSENSTFKIDHKDMEGFSTLNKSYSHEKELHAVNMRDVRGKIVLLNRVTKSYGYIWADLTIQDKYELSMTYYQQVIIPGIKERTQNFFGKEIVIVPGVKERTQSVPNGWNYAEKTKYISQFLNEHRANSSNNLNINLLTASSSSPEFYIPFSNGVEQNARVQNSFIENKRLDVNGMIFPMDYPTERAIDKIIESNN